MGELALGDTFLEIMKDSHRYCNICQKEIQIGEETLIHEIVDITSEELDVEFYEFECPACRGQLKKHGIRELIREVILVRDRVREYLQQSYPILILMRATF